MKNILVLVSLLIAAAACSTAPPANKDVTANANKVASEMTSTVSESDIIAKDKAASMASVKDIDLSDVTFTDWKMLPINKNVVLITYNATQKGTFKGAAI